MERLLLTPMWLRLIDQERDEMAQGFETSLPGLDPDFDEMDSSALACLNLDQDGIVDE